MLLKRRESSALLLLLFLYSGKAQVANYVSNGGFEEYYYCGFPNDIRITKRWSSLDSSQTFSQYYNSCSGIDNIPSNSFTYQFPRSGDAFVGVTLYCLAPCDIETNRSFIKNRLKQKLEAGKTYCVKFYVNITNNSSHGIDKIGAYFGDNTLDTITKCNLPLTYLTPQVSNFSGNVIVDTLNWIPITGTFVAAGTEKFMVIGNFSSNAQTNTLTINTTTNYIDADVCVDDVSCIDMDLQAYAGPDVTYVTGAGNYIGRPQDVGIDEMCQWYKLPIVITPTTPAIDTAAGIYVSPTETSTYVVRQEICGNVKWDTVVVYKDWVGFDEMSRLQNSIQMYPNPANALLNFKYDDAREGEVISIVFRDPLGQTIREEELVFKDKQAKVLLQELVAGSYVVFFKDQNGSAAHKKLVIAR